MKLNWIVSTAMLKTNGMTGDLAKSIIDAGHRAWLTDDRKVSDIKPEWAENNFVMLYGPVSFVTHCRLPFYPHSYGLQNDILDCRTWMSDGDIYPSLLNKDFIMLPFGSIFIHSDMIRSLFGDHIFIRPDSSKKPFAGRTIHMDDLFYELSSIRQLDYVFDNEMCLISKAVPIKAEYRMVVADKEIVDYSKYMEDGQFKSAHEISPESLRYAESVVKDISIDLIYVMDIAELPSGETKIIEFNSFNTSGLYATDKRKVVYEVSKVVLDNL